MSSNRNRTVKLPKIPPMPSEDENMDLSQNTLLSTLMNDPTKWAMLRHFLASEQGNIAEYKKQQAKQQATAKKINKLNKYKISCESPTAQFRKRALAQMNSANSPVNSDSECSSTSSSKDLVKERVPFHELLRGLVMYVEVLSNGEDKSSSAKALVQAMGATVCDRLTTHVTHVVFKDGSYQTYHLAKRLKMHVVSILWLEAVKRHGGLVAEKAYPAFGADDADVNITTMCKNIQDDYEEVCRDERRRITETINAENTPPNKSTTNNVSKTPSAQKKTMSLVDRVRETLDFNLSSSDDDDGSVFLSAKSKRLGSTSSSTKLPSDFSSYCGQIDGETCRNLNDSLEITANTEESESPPKQPSTNRNRRRTIYNPEHNSLLEINMSKNKRKTMFAINVLKESNTNSVDMDLTGFQPLETSVTNETNGSNESKASLESNNASTRTSLNSMENATPRKSSLESNNSSARTSLNSMDLTSFVSARRRSTRIASQTEDAAVFKKPESARKLSKDSSFSERLSNLRLSSGSNKIDGKFQSENLTSSLHVSDRTSTGGCSEKSGTTDLMEDLSHLRISTENLTTEEDMSALQVSNDDSGSSKGTKRRSKDGEDLSTPKKGRNSTKEDNPSVSEEKCRTESTSDKSDSSGKKKTRKLYDCDNPINEQLLLKSIDAEKTKKTKRNETAPRRLNPLLLKPFVLTPDRSKGWNNDDSDDNSNSERPQRVQRQRKIQVGNDPMKPRSKSLISKKTDAIFSTKSSCYTPSGIKPAATTTTDVQDIKKRMQKKPVSPKLINTRNNKATSVKSTSGTNATPGTKSTNATKGNKKPELVANSKIAKQVETDNTRCGKSTEEDDNTIDLANDDLTKDSNPTATHHPPNPTKPPISTQTSNTNTPKTPSTFATPRTPSRKQPPPPRTPTRKSCRFATPITYKHFYNDDKSDKSSTSDEDTRDKSAPIPAAEASVAEVSAAAASRSSVITPRFNRRSTLDFQNMASRSTGRSGTCVGGSGYRVGQKAGPRPGIACTRFKVGRLNTFGHIVRKLGRFVIDDNVVARTTHLVVGENKRTINLLRGIARGCWILSADWLYKSMSAGKWLPEEDFEFTDFSEAVQTCRKEREAFAPAPYNTDTFAACGPIYISARATRPPRDDLGDLVRLCGGRVAPAARSASIVVGEVARYDTVQHCVTELWLLDSVAQNRVQPPTGYSLLEAEAGVLLERRLSDDY